MSRTRRCIALLARSTSRRTNRWISDPNFVRKLDSSQAASPPPIATEPNSFGHRFLDRVQIKNNKTGELGEIPAKGLFYAVGHIPNTAFLDGQLETDDAGYLLTKVRSTATDIPGVFACGDVQDHVYRQAVSAAGTGCMAALDAERYLRERGIGE